MRWLAHVWCWIFGHNAPITFRPDGIYWCQSAGPYDCVCLRCGWRWETTTRGAIALLQSQTKDPRQARTP